MSALPQHMQHNRKTLHHNICMVTIYEDYGDEPADRFMPLPDHLGCSFYDLEMEGYTEDIAFFNKILPAEGNVLELGCGSGRVGRGLASPERVITGIDISLSMLKRARQHSSTATNFVAMDMTNIAFSCLFDAVIVPYNSLNLLVTKENILQCLGECRKHLPPGKPLIAQIFIPTKKFLREKRKTFQFQIFDLENGDRLIKEILKEYQPDSHTIAVEERFRYRPATSDAARADYHNCFSVAAFTINTWRDMLKAQGFQIESSYEDFNMTPIHSSDSSSLITICS